MPPLVLDSSEILKGQFNMNLIKITIEDGFGNKATYRTSYEDYKGSWKTMRIDKGVPKHTFPAVAINEQPLEIQALNILQTIVSWVSDNYLTPPHIIHRLKK